jgi:predicted aspartyl protease
MEINNYTSKGLVDTMASMFVLITSMVKELGIMHLVPKSKSYKIASRVVT